MAQRRRLGQRHGGLPEASARAVDQGKLTQSGAVALLLVQHKLSGLELGSRWTVASIFYFVSEFFLFFSCSFRHR